MSRYRSLLLFLLLSATWGTAFVAIKAGLAYFPPVLFAALRYDVAGLLMVGYAAVVLDDPVPRGTRQWLAVLVGSVLLIAGYTAFVFVGETDPAVTSAVAAVIVSLSPVLTAAFARVLVPDERLTPLGIAGLAVGLVGVVVLADPDPGALLSGGVVAKLAVLAGAACFALGAVLVRRLDADLPIESMEAWSMLGGAVVLHAVSIGLGESTAAVRWTLEAVAALGFLSVASSALAFLAYFHLLDRVGPVEINLVSYVAPVFAALVGWLALGETVGATTAVGFACIVVGFLALKRRAIAEEAPWLRRAVGEAARELRRRLPWL